VGRKKDLISVCRGGRCDGQPFDGRKNGGQRFADALEGALREQGLEGVGFRETGCRDRCKKGRIVTIRVGDAKVHFGRVNDTETLNAIIGAAAAVLEGGRLPQCPLLDSHALHTIKRRWKEADGND
jgi:hypothetical protein